MIRNSRTRRALSVMLMLIGGILLFLAPGQVWIGAVMVALGVALELIGIVIAHRRKDSAI